MRKVNDLVNNALILAIFSLKLCNFNKISTKICNFLSFVLADFGNLRVTLEYFFKANQTVKSLYTSADIKIDFTVSFEPVDGFWQFKSHFGVLFQGQFNSEVTVHFS